MTLKNTPSPVYALPALVCAVGFFMRVLLSAPVLNIVGIEYGSEDASLFTKIHPGTWFILLSFVLLLAAGRSPIDQLLAIARRHTAFFGFFAIYVAILIYWGIRGPKGIGLIVDVHIVVPICAIVFSYAPRPMLWAMARLFVGIATVNSAIGLIEAATHRRLFPYDPSWEVLNQDYFRASALMGHPLSNASFTAIALFVTLGLPLRPVVKIPAFAVMLASLIAFGGRSALVFAVVGLALLGCIYLVRQLRSGRMSFQQTLFTVLATLTVPMLCAALLSVLLTTGIGARLTAYQSLNDDSAGVRLLAFQALDYMSVEELIFGVDGDRILAIGTRTGVSNPTSDIENPWLLMLMFLGAIMFTLWLIGLGVFLWRLMRSASPALKFAVVEYFLISSTSNSFGRKDSVLLIMAGMVVCAKIVAEPDRTARPLAHLKQRAA